MENKKISTNLNLKQWDQLWETIIKWKNKEGRFPNYADKFGLRIYKKEYEDAFKRVQQFNKLNGRLPRFIKVVGEPLIPATPSLVKNSAWLLIESVFGKCNNATEIYNAILKKGKYLNYLNSRFKRITAVHEAVLNGVNCVNYALFLYPALVGAGYEVKFAHSKVQCSNGNWYGHVYLMVLGHEFKKWTRYDGSAAGSVRKRPLGTLICIGGETTPKYNEQWLFDLLKLQ